MPPRQAAEGFARKASRRGAFVYITGTDPAIRQELLLHGVRPPVVNFQEQLEDALRIARRHPADNLADQVETFVQSA